MVGYIFVSSNEEIFVLRSIFFSNPYGILQLINI